MELSAQISNTRRWLVQEYAIREEYVMAFIEMYDKATDLEQQLKILNIPVVMPPLVAFKERRQKLRLSMQEVTNNTGVSKATISRIERGHKADYENVMKLNNFYASNGA